jgi:hypothetical protein
MEAESRGLVDATSLAGAMGLMQIMPETYAELRARYRLGTNAYDPHDNIMAGAAYMSEMIERFGAPNFLAAYNAGPTRLDGHLRRGRPLPAETVRYLAQIGELPAVPLPTGDVPAFQSPAVVDASLNAPSPSPRTNSNNAAEPPMIAVRADPGQHRRPTEIAGPRGLFVRRWNTPHAVLPPDAWQASDVSGRFSGALFVPLGRDPVRVSANPPSRHPE